MELINIFVSNVMYPWISIDGVIGSLQLVLGNDRWICWISILLVLMPHDCNSFRSFVVVLVTIATITNTIDI